MIRWQHPERGRLAPSAFLTLAEETGLIVGIGVRVIEEACGRLAADPSVEQIAVNVSPTHLGAGDLAGAVRSALDRHGVSPERLVLEITESAVLEGYGPTLRDLGRIHATGVRFAVDDFGTGYAALSFLRKFPVSMLKLDRSFVAGLPADDGSARISEAVLALSKGMGLTLIAEGVETARQEQWLANRGCDQVQGSCWGKPARWEHLPRTMPTVA